MRHILTILAVTDLAAATKFYVQGLGLEQVVAAPVYSELVDPSGQRLGLYQRESFVLNTSAPVQGPPSTGTTTATELYFHCVDPAKAAAKLMVVGALLLSPLAARPWGDEAVYLQDLEGNVVVLARPLAP